MLAQKILEAIQEPIALDVMGGHISASIGIILHHPSDTDTADQVVNRADAAMYEAKRAGKARICAQ